MNLKNIAITCVVSLGIFGCATLTSSKGRLY